MKIILAGALALMATTSHAEDAIKRDPAINWNLPIEEAQRPSTIDEDKKRVVTAVGVVAIIGLAVAAIVAGPGSDSR